MKRFLVVVACAAILVGPVPWADAQVCGVRSVQKTFVSANAVQTKVLTPYLQTVNTFYPVQQFNGVSYSYNGSYQPQSQASASSADQLRQIIREEIRAALGGAEASGGPPPDTLVTQHCVKCHGPNKAEKGLRLDLPLTAEQRVLAGQRVLTNEMPPKNSLTDGPLDDQVRGNLLGELLGVPQ